MKKYILWILLISLSLLKIYDFIKPKTGIVFKKWKFYGCYSNNVVHNFYTNNKWISVADYTNHYFDIIYLDIFGNMRKDIIYVNSSIYKSFNIKWDKFLPVKKYGTNWKYNMKLGN